MAGYLAEVTSTGKPSRRGEVYQQIIRVGGSLMKPYVKKCGKALLRRLGYKGERGDEVSRETLLAQTGEDAAYYTKYSTRWPIFAPWVGHPDFLTAYNEVAGWTFVGPDRAYMLMSLAYHAKHL